jgi:Flp pilus assembly protein TadD
MLRKGDLPRAVELLERAAQLQVADPQVLEHLGDAYRAAGRAADAVAAYRRALGCFGDEPRAEQLRLRAALERKLSSLAATAR